MIERVQRHKELLESQLVIAHVFLGIVGVILDAFNQFRVKKTEAHKNGVQMRKHEIDDFTHLFQDLLEDFNKLSVYELRTVNFTRMFVAIRMNLRSIKFNCDLYFKIPKIYSPTDFKELD